MPNSPYRDLIITVTPEPRRNMDSNPTATGTGTGTGGGLSESVIARKEILRFSTIQGNAPAGPWQENLAHWGESDVTAMRQTMNYEETASEHPAGGFQNAPYLEINGVVHEQITGYLKPEVARLFVEARNSQVGQIAALSLSTLEMFASDSGSSAADMRHMARCILSAMDFMVKNMRPELYAGAATEESPSDQ